MKRLLVLVAVLVPLSFFVAGCGGPSGSSSKSSEGTADEKQKRMEEMQQKVKSGKMNQPAPGATQK